jgi:hypothetical protein
MMLIILWEIKKLSQGRIYNFRRRPRRPRRKERNQSRNSQVKSLNNIIEYLKGYQNVKVTQP